VLWTSFPASALIAQHNQLSSASAQLLHLQSENRLLAEQDQQLKSNAEIDRLARQDYQMVLPGQTLFDVLPPSGATSTPGAPTSGDPGSQPLVAPADAPDMRPDPGLPQLSSGTSTAAGTTGSALSGGRSGSGPTGTAAKPSSFWSRVTDTLEFWK
jgi:hypothetical protein